MSTSAGKRTPVPGVVVYQRGRKWAYRLELERDPLTGDRRREYQSGYATQDEAWKAAVKAKADHERGQRVAPAKRAVAGFVAEWMATIQHSIKPSTYVNYGDYQGAYVLPLIGQKKLQDVDVPTLNGLYRHLLRLRAMVRASSGPPRPARPARVLAQPCRKPRKSRATARSRRPGSAASAGWLMVREARNAANRNTITRWFITDDQVSCPDSSCSRR